MTYKISEYSEGVRATDQFREDEIQPILLGLFGEVGSVMSAVKKLKRENKAYIGFRENVIDELGDAFWYFTALTHRFDISLEKLLGNVNEKSMDSSAIILASDDSLFPIALSNRIGPKADVCDEALVEFGQSSASMLRIQNMNADERLEAMRLFAQVYLQVLVECNVSFAEVLAKNAAKSASRFGILDLASLPDFDAKYPEYEQLPRQFEIEMRERDNGRVYLRWNGVFVGDPLTDNIAVNDGFRYHDVILSTAE